MYPKDDFNQRLQLALNRVAVKQIIIEVQESYGDIRNRTLDLERHQLDSMEYSEGVLEVSYIYSEEGGNVTEFITWDRIHGITFRDYVCKLNPFPKTGPHNSHIIS